MKKKLVSLLMAVCMTASMVTAGAHAVMSKTNAADDSLTDKHMWSEGEVLIEPTETQSGIKVYTCLICGAEMKEILPIIGHDEHKWDCGEITLRPTSVTTGLITYTCTVCGTEKHDVLEMLAPTNHKWHQAMIKEPATIDSYGIEILICEICNMTKEVIIPKLTVDFQDVHADMFFTPAVHWAVQKKITSGTTPTTFSPYLPCTRAQAVTFLWRAYGSPKYEEIDHPFTDVSESDYYYDAVMWAVEHGITSGTTDSTFSPDLHCTRAQAVTFMHRAMDCPKVDITHNFEDVEPGSYYAEAVEWAVDEQITRGTSDTTFSPDSECTRGQIVTFLYRDLA